MCNSLQTFGSATNNLKPHWKLRHSEIYTTTILKRPSKTCKPVTVAKQICWHQVLMYAWHSTKPSFIFCFRRFEELWRGLQIRLFRRNIFPWLLGPTFPSPLSLGKKYMTLWIGRSLKKTRMDSFSTMGWEYYLSVQRVLVLATRVY